MLPFVEHAVYAEYGTSFVDITRISQDLGKQQQIHYQGQNFYIAERQKTGEAGPALKLLLVPNPGKKNYAAMGSLTKEQDFQGLIRNFKAYVHENENSHLYILGDGNERKDLEKLLLEEGLTKCVTMTGYVAEVSGDGYAGAPGDGDRSRAHPVRSVRRPGGPRSRSASGGCRRGPYPT